MGALNQMIGSMSLMREDILMCMYANLTGMAIYFPLLFRMKFRFTNKTLLTSTRTGSITLQPDSTAYHLSPSIVVGLLHRRYVQNTGNFRVYVKHSAVDDS